MNPQFFYLSGVNKAADIFVPIKKATQVSLLFSTYRGNTRICNYEGSEFAYFSPSKMIDSTTNRPLKYNINYDSEKTGNIIIKALQGRNDIYSLRFENQDYNIEDFPIFIKQFPNIFSFFIDVHTDTGPAEYPIIQGDLCDVPASVRRIDIGNARVNHGSKGLYANISSFPQKSKLEFFRMGAGTFQNVKIFGDISELPSSIKYFSVLQAESSSKLIYSKKKQWNTVLDSLNVFPYIDYEQIDSLLIDLAESVNIATGNKSIVLNNLRSSKSDAAAAYLLNLGFSLNVSRISSKILKLPLTSNLVDFYAHNASPIGSEVHEEGGLRTMNNQAAFIPQTTDLDIGTGSIHFGCTFKIKNLTNVFGLIGKSIYGSVNGRYALFVENNILFFLVQNPGNPILGVSVLPFNDGNFHKVECIYDRTKGRMKMIIDGIMISQIAIPISSSNVACNAKFHIGAYGNSSGSAPQANLFFDGIIKDVFFNKF